MHKRKLLALVVAGTLGAPLAASADTANVNVYGKLYPQFQISKAKAGSTSGVGLSDLTRTSGVFGQAASESTQAVNASNSYVGFKGEIDVGGGTKGWFQVEQSVELDQGAPEDATWANRDSAAGISGAFGNVFLGNWTTVYKEFGTPVSFLGLSSGNFVSSSNVLSRVGFGSSRGTRFHERAANYIQYDTPDIGGFQFSVGYSPDEGKTATIDDKLLSMGVKWEAGPLYIALAREVWDDRGITNSIGNGIIVAADAGQGVGTTTATNTEDTATRLSVAYSITKETRIGLDVARLEYEAKGHTGAATNQFKSYEKNTAELTVTHKMGSTEFAVSYVDSDAGKCELTGNTCSTSGLEAKMINLGVKHTLGKNLAIFGLASKLDNGPGANHNNTDLTVAPGADATTYAAGIEVRF